MMETLQDLIEEAKVRFVWWGIAIFAICYFLSHTSKSMSMNIPISILLAFALRTLLNHVEFRWKSPPSRKQTYLSYLEKKQVSVNDPRLSNTPPPQKWKRKIDSPVVQAALEDFIDLILRDFVIDLWYSDITPDKEAPELIRGIILDALGEVAGRVKDVNLVDLLTRDMIDLVGDHLEMYRRNQASIGVDVMGTLSSEERDERLKHHLMASKELHPALVSSESEYKFLQQLMAGIIALVLRQREAQCPLVRCIAREFLTCLVIQPLLNLASPVYINELIEYIVLNLDDVMNMTIVEGGSGSSKVHQNHPVSIGTADSGQSTLEKSAIPHTQQSDTTHSNVGNWRENSVEVSDSSSSTSHGGTIQPKTADWARVLDAATQRRTEVLAPENLENMWARGRNYKNKLNRAAKGHQATGAKGLPNTDILLNDFQKPASIPRAENTKMDDKAIVKFPQGSSLTNESKDSKVNESKLSHSLAGESTSRGSMMDDINANAVAGGANKIRLKRSNSTSALKIEPDEKRANTNETKGIIISEEFYSPDFGKHSMEQQRFKGASDTVMHAEVSRCPKLRCRVLGAYFEKIGSKSFAVYSIAVTDSENNTWFVKRRYRNFERLHRHLKDIPNYTLHLPPKRIFSSSTEDAFVHQRCIHLDKYLQDLLSIANVAEQHEVWDFLSVSSKNYSFGKSPSVMRTLAVNVDDAVDDIVRQFKGVSDGLMRKVVGSSPSHSEASQSVPFRYLSWNADDTGSLVSGQSSIERANSSSDNEEEVDNDQNHPQKELVSSAQSSAYHSDNELDAKDFHPLIVKEIEESKSLDFEKKYESKSEWTDRDRSTSLPSISANLEDPVGVPPEWSPPNVTVPALNLVDKIFQLNRRGWLRRQVFWISKQILQLVMEDAIDDWLLGQINWLRRDDVVAQGIRWVQNTLWPEGKFFIKLGLNSGKSDDSESDSKSSRTIRHAASSKVRPSDSFEAQLEAARRASDVKKLLFNGAPTTLVSLIGQKQYKRCARDMYYFTQSSICIKQLAYGGLELVIVSIFPELRELVVDIHKKMRRQSGSPA